MPDRWRPPFEIPDSAKRVLESQRELSERLRELTEPFDLRRALGETHRATDALRELYESSQATTMLRDILAEETAQADYVRHALDDVKVLSSPDVLQSLRTAQATYPFLQSSSVHPSKSLGSGAQYMNDSSELQRKLQELQNQLMTLRRETAEKAIAFRTLEEGSAEKDRAIGELQRSVDELTEARKLAHLLVRVEPAAQRQLLDSPEFRAEFDRQEPCDAYVMSIDIRRSTELMLKARDPKLFAQFLIGLTQKLRKIVLANHGVFDKFTGDGVLAFFPSFYSGRSAGLLAMRAAQEAHTAFAEHYDSNRHCFLTVRRDAGLGIGIDFGSVQIVQIESEFTVVGTPVVYACRMAGAEPGQTLLNQPAFEALSATHSVECDFTAVELALKHEGPTLAYAARLNGRSYELSPPPWQPVADEPSKSDVAT